jgi:hypothetical protein
MLKNQNPTMITVPGAVRDTFNQLAKDMGKQQHQVVAEAAELLRKREERKQKGGSRG